MSLIDGGTGVFWLDIRTVLNNLLSANVKHTAIGGIAVKFTNKTGAPSIKGYLVDPSPSVDLAVILTTIGVPDCVGVFLDDGVADGSEAMGRGFRYC